MHSKHGIPNIPTTIPALTISSLEGIPKTATIMTQRFAKEAMKNLSTRSTLFMTLSKNYLIVLSSMFREIMILLSSLKRTVQSDKDKLTSIKSEFSSFKESTLSVLEDRFPGMSKGKSIGKDIHTILKNMSKKMPKIVNTLTAPNKNLKTKC